MTGVAEGAVENPSPTAAPSAPTGPKGNGHDSEWADNYRADLMRRRRKDPLVKTLEKQRNQARDDAIKALIAAHHDEFLVYVNRFRAVRGLDPYQPRGRASIPSPQTPAPLAVQASCRHNQGLKKLSYGIFCSVCGFKLR